jgi:hypothetical protein
MDTSELFETNRETLLKFFQPRDLYDAADLSPRPDDFVYKKCFRSYISVARFRSKIFWPKSKIFDGKSNGRKYRDNSTSTMNCQLVSLK